MPKRNKHSLSHRKMFTHDMGELIPCGLLEVLPGDTIQAATSALLRAAPMLAPPMHPVDVRIHHWFVPHRLVWGSWENFITGGPDGLNASVFPTIALTTPAVGSLADYLGVPTGANITVSALPFRGYALIWNQWYRDQDLETSLVVSTADGADTTTNIALQNCDWEKDYFTSARPWEQKGPTITLPLGSTAPVLGIGFLDGQATNSLANMRQAGTGAAAAMQGLTTSGGSQIQIKSQTTGNVGASNRPDVQADLSNATAASINTLRQAFALQRFEEARARYGSRYVEYLRYLGVRSSDSRLDRAEYLGGGRDTISFSEVLQTAADGANPVGTMRGHGITAMRSNRFRRFFEEHGYMYTFLSVRPKTMYLQGIPRTWNRRSKEDFWQVELQHIGQQKILNKEIYAQAASPDGTFGYQDRYDEYRRQESWISGEFKNLVPLTSWHFARNFGAEPALNASFVKCVPPETPFATPANDVLWTLVKHSIQARRLVASTGTSFIY